MPSEIPAPEPSEARLTARRDWTAAIRSDGHAVVEDPVAGKHYRLGASEYTFLVHLARRGDAAEAHQAAAAADPTWSRESSQRLLSWFVQRGLVTLDGHSLTPPQVNRKMAELSDPLFLRLSLGSPSAIIARAERCLRPLAGAWGGAAALMLMLVALVVFVTNQSDFLTPFERLRSQTGLLTLAVTGLALKVLHELGHGLACHAYGGAVRNWGLLFICGAPLPFIDVSESRRFPSRWSRVCVALAGVFAEALFTSLVVIAAVCVDGAFAYHLAAHLVLTFGLAALLFNLNPLMKFDGYYILSDVLGVDNLYSRGSEYVRRLAARLLLNRGAPATGPTPWHIRVYGVLSFAWRTFTFLMIAWLAVSLLQFIGLALVLWSAWRLWGRAALAWRRSSMVPRPDSPADRLGWSALLRPTCLFALCAAAIGWIPIPYGATSYATVEYDPPSIIRAPADAFVERVHAVDNQAVARGDLLLTLRSESIAEEWLKTKALCGRHEQRVRVAHSRQDMRELKRARFDLEAARELFRQVDQRQDALVIRSPSDGVLSSRNLDELLGAYLTEGSVVAAVGQEDAKRLRALAPPDSRKLFREGRGVHYAALSGASGEATVQNVLPRATRAAENSSLGAHQGGPLDVMIDDTGKAEFNSPYTPILIGLGPQQSADLKVGQRVAVTLAKQRTVADWLWHQLPALF